jgi:cysteinyl-tRNA synthetase
VFGDEGLEEAGQALTAFYRLIQRFERITGQPFYWSSKAGDAADQLAYATNRAHGEAYIRDRADGDFVAEIAQLRKSYLEKMDDDFNTAGAVSDLFDMSRVINRFVDQAGLEDPKKRSKQNIELFTFAMSVLRELGAILGLFIKPPRKGAGDDSAKLVDQLMQLMIQLRAEARSAKNFATADAIRNGLTKLGISLQDLKEGTTWEKA